MAVTLESRLWAKVRKTDTCWLWTGATTKGYGVIGLGGRKEGLDAVHRVSYRLSIGPIPEGKELDHLCHNADKSCPGNECAHRRCVRPSHLEAVTHQVNVRRGLAPSASSAYQRGKTVCKRGHPFDEKNTGIDCRGNRRCRRCHALAEMGRRAELKGGVPSA